MKRAGAGRLSAALLLVIIVSQAGCSLLRRGEQEVYEPAPIGVAVDNRGWSQVAIYVVAGGQRHRLGEVVATSSGAFELPGVFTHRTDVRLVAAPLASRQQYVTPVILVQPGETIYLTVMNVLSMSSYSVR